MSQLETLFTQAWQKQATWLWLLLPLSWLYALISMIRRWLYRQGWLKSYRATIPVMVIGNISVGGSGKTPLIITLVEYLQQQGVAVGVISRGYSGDVSQMPAIVTQESLPTVVGDEPCLIVASTSVPMAVCPNRQQAIETLQQQYPDVQLIIADDGLQHYALQRDIEWIVVDSARGFGNRQLLPTGFLRESVARLKTATVIYHIPTQQTVDKVINVNIKNSAASPPKQMWLQPALPQKLVAASEGGQTIQQPVQAEDGMEVKQDCAPKQGEMVYAVTGIGYPKRFFNTLQQLGYQVIERAFADHHDFLAEDLLGLDKYPILVTSKDAVKIQVLARNNPQIAALPIWVIPVRAQLTDACYTILKQQLSIVNIRY
ncbi:tetraacyldisaccharide 4'-kinase [Psychrobacter sp. I-STPA10]|uniref:tetraacyldisaccharide 4'-kinase n=1 Tax=Psychrobacter sp. I-STPA10 TaxID=2585769 RepID=UPI001E5F0F4A|nr:tetraacyldisaccharide 4'-kinase [Psychrobacter sp. I-STPA10]